MLGGAGGSPAGPDRDRGSGTGMRWALGCRCALPLGTVWGLGTTTTQGMIGESWLL